MISFFYQLGIPSLFAMRFSSHSEVDYSPYTTEVLIPFFNRSSTVPPFTNGPRVTFRVDNHVYEPVIDTGTCGLIVSAADFPKWTPELAENYPLGYEYLSSSRRLYVGNWIPKNLHFFEGNVTTSVPILVVTKRYTCQGYNITTDGPNCTSPTEVIDMPQNISLMGVGFGRQLDGQPQGNPDKNPFLNVININGTPIDSTSPFRAGYKITKEGVTLGLTANNTASFSFAKLKDGRTEDPRDWATISTSLRVGNASYAIGTALIDTGIDQMYLTVPLSMPVATHIEPSRSTGANVSVLDDGQMVEVLLGEPGNDAASYKFEVGNKDSVETGMAPPQVIVKHSSTLKPFVNTGRHFYRGFEVIFDAIGGRYGFKAIR